jgi:hypothetical protein
LSADLSEANTTTAPAWRRFVAVFVGGFFGLLALILAALVLIDPYDTGYFPSPIGPGLVDDNDFTGTASRGRDPRFDAAIFGNSHGLLIDPVRLSAATSLSFVQLTTLGTGPREHMELMGYFLGRHADVRAIVIVADQTWCTHDPALPSTLASSGYEFPLWLFADNRLRYLANLLNMRSIRLARRRVQLGLGMRAPIAPIGVAAYPDNWDWEHEPDAPPQRFGMPLNGSPGQIDRSFPAVDRFATMLGGITDAVSIVVVLPPTYYMLLPAPETKEDAELAICKDRLADVLGRRRRTAFFDFLTDSAISRERLNFADVRHMRQNVARLIEERIVSGLNSSR